MNCKIWENGVIREMTSKEIEEIKNQIVPEEIKETIEDRLEKLEKLFDKLSKFLGVE